MLAAHQDRAGRTLSLIPSEGVMAPLARLPLVADLAARYLFDEDPDPQMGDWRFPSAREAAWLETGLAVPLLARMLGAASVNVRPLSGLHALQMVIAALAGPPGTTVACLSPAQGAHYATADVARRLGHDVVHLPAPDGRPRQVDPDGVCALLRACRPSLVYVDQCHALEVLDMRALADAVKAAGMGTVLHADISHTLGLVLGGALPNPLAEGADSVSASTHKTFPGPPKGIIATRTPGLGERVRAVQPQSVSQHHLGAVAALGLALASFTDHAPLYAHAVLANARTLGKHLAHGGWTLEGAPFGYTRTHQLWVTRTPLPAREAAGRLYGAGIHVNWLTDLPLPGPALRLGVAEATWLGLTGGDMEALAGIMTAAVDGSRPLEELAARTAALRPARPYPYATPPAPAGRAAAGAVAAAALGEVGGS